MKLILFLSFALGPISSARAAALGEWKPFPPANPMQVGQVRQALRAQNDLTADLSALVGFNPDSYRDRLVLGGILQHAPAGPLQAVDIKRALQENAAALDAAVIARSQEITREFIGLRASIGDLVQESRVLERFRPFLGEKGIRALDQFRSTRDRFIVSHLRAVAQLQEESEPVAPMVRLEPDVSRQIIATYVRNTASPDVFEPRVLQTVLSLRKDYPSPSNDSLTVRVRPELRAQIEQIRPGRGARRSNGTATLLNHLLASLVGILHGDGDPVLRWYFLSTLPNLEPEPNHNNQGIGTPTFIRARTELISDLEIIMKANRGLTFSDLTRFMVRFVHEFQSPQKP